MSIKIVGEDENAEGTKTLDLVDDAAILAAAEAVDSPEEIINRAAEARLAFIEARREKLCEAWIAETGILPSECVMIVQQTLDGGIKCWIEKKADALDLAAMHRLRDLLDRGPDMGQSWRQALAAALGGIK